MKFYSIITVLILLILFPSLSYGQMDQQDITIEEERRSLNYVPATHSNLAQLLWTYNKYDYKNNDILDNFLNTKNCILYEKYYGDEFVWENIRQGLRREIRYYSNEYPTRLEIISYIPLGRYDFSKQAFDIETPFQLVNQGAVIVPFENPRISGCKISPYSDDFPELVKFRPDNKFALTNIPIRPDTADLLLDRIQKYTYNGQRGGRIVALRIRIKVNSVNDPVMRGDDVEELVFNGQIDDVTVFEDPFLRVPIWGRSFKNLQ